MNEALRKDGLRIAGEAIKAVRPDEAVKRTLEGKNFPGKVVLVAAGKAAWQMAKTAMDVAGDKVDCGIVITKHGHSMGDIPGLEIREAGHPVPDADSFSATERALELVSGLGEKDTVLFLLSGGGSALFERPLSPEEELQDFTNQLMACGADIVEINTLRKRLSAVKGGKFASACLPAKIFSIILSDILGDPLDMIASGPAVPDSSSCEQAWKIIKKYDLKLSDEAKRLMDIETPKEVTNAENIISGSVKELCRAASDVCRELGYEPVFLTDKLCCDA